MNYAVFYKIFTEEKTENNCNTVFQRSGFVSDSENKEKCLQLKL